MKLSLMAPTVVACVLAWGSVSVQAEENPPASAEDSAQLSREEAYRQWSTQFLSSLNRQTGNVSLVDGKVTLAVPDHFYYLSPEDSKRVLEEAWGNPESGLTQGMLFPAAYSPLDSGSWGVTIEYEAEGHVSDEDAASMDYDALLKDMQASAEEESQARVKAGYEPIALIGWATKPYYDAQNHKLYWAKELKFGDSNDHTLNYNVRALGREGVLVMNFIAEMPQLAEIENARDEVLGMVNFNSGHTYSEFNPDIDTVAAYGIGGLIAGKVLAKAGVLAAGLVLLKKFWFVLLLPFYWLKNRFTHKKES